MESIKFYTEKNLRNYFNRREGETKFGEKIRFIKDLEELENHQSKFVLFGIPEDIGIRANHGKAGAAGAWQECLKALLNIQHNEFTHPEDLIVLGEIDCRDLMEKASFIDEDDPNYHQKLGDLVKKLDSVVSNLVEEIVSAGKVPIIIGGGHNNAFGNIRGTSKALKKPLNVLNIDAHTDLRRLEHRHSGNGFSFAKEQGYLGKYAVFGLHQNYTPQYIFEDMQASEVFRFHLFEDLLLMNFEMKTACYNSLKQFVNSGEYGLEIDCDAIENFPSSAQSPSGFGISEIRTYIRLSKGRNCKYLHLCEAAPKPGKETMVGKALSYFITDFLSKDIIMDSRKEELH